MSYKQFTTSFFTVLKTSSRPFSTSWRALAREVPFWPTSSLPTPYEILGLTQSEGRDPKLLKRKYRELCKIYHPDISGAKTFYDLKGKIIEKKDKENRFKQINNAYNLLRDPSKRELYDRFRTGWTTSDAPYKSPFGPGSVYQHATRYNTRDEQFWDAGTWEDYRRQKQREDEDPVFKSELAKKNRDVLIMCAGLAAFVMCVQMANALDHLSAEHELIEKGNYEAHNSLLLAYLNHGLGLDKWSRINHFMWARRYGLYHDDEAKLAEQEKEDHALLEDMKRKTDLKA